MSDARQSFYVGYLGNNEYNNDSLHRDPITCNAWKTYILANTANVLANSRATNAVNRDHEFLSYIVKLL